MCASRTIRASRNCHCQTIKHTNTGNGNVQAKPRVNNKRSMKERQRDERSERAWQEEDWLRPKSPDNRRCLFGNTALAKRMHSKRIDTNSDTNARRRHSDSIVRHGFLRSTRDVPTSTHHWNDLAEQNKIPRQRNNTPAHVAALLKWAFQSTGS